MTYLEYHITSYYFRLRDITFHYIYLLYFINSFQKILNNTFIENFGLIIF